ncbi:phage shock protein operon transcriptional activator [Aliidiomarina taiwanensis]|uniref:Phage shock protein operon transcriptional activator n=1 Tax=Aliidiomarina taiwanensis TaxID=946228 RepID=A0A432XA63_9GAMM|nr:phage shock protein operon transcriptional activator [Aliidiomarina taiwanensis]RUO44206.1 phage shock protein operon transcriptional activator [Aliidiomarina taiwanensis]
MHPTRPVDNLIGQSDSFLAVLEHVSQAAPMTQPVLIIGERGTGKELVAERLHYLSQRWEQPYIKLNCAALNENLLDSELFGHEAGAFTGASRKHEGRFERAHGGTLFLDELATTSSLIQEKLLRVIEYGEFERVGGQKTVRTNARLVAATNEDLPNLAAQGKFRADLLDRLAFDVITLPPLRERAEDILVLAEHFAIQMTRQLGLSCFAGFTSQAKQTLEDYHWPGNIRELKNVVERSVYRTNSDEVPVSHIILDPFESPWRPATAAPTDQESSVVPAVEPITTQPYLPAFGDDFDLKKVSQAFEKSLLEKALAEAQFNQKRTAELVGLTYHQLRGYLKKYGLLEGMQRDN